METKDQKGKVDAFLRKIMSRKLLVWTVSTIALFTGFIDADVWSMISIGYIGSQGVADIAATIKNEGE